MIQLESALELATKRRASDVHFSVGRPIMIRVDGTLLQLNDDILKPADIKDAFPPRQARRIPAHRLTDQIQILIS